MGFMHIEPCKDVVVSCHLAPPDCCGKTKYEIKENCGNHMDDKIIACSSKMLLHGILSRGLPLPLGRKLVEVNITHFKNDTQLLTILSMLRSIIALVING